MTHSFFVDFGMNSALKNAQIKTMILTTSIRRVTSTLANKVSTNSTVSRYRIMQ